MSQVINWSGRPVGNGVDYPVRKGCSKYDFTVEQIEQKKEKRTRMVSVSVCLCLCMWGGGGGEACVGGRRAHVCVCVCLCMCGRGCVCVYTLLMQCWQVYERVRHDSQ